MAATSEPMGRTQRERLARESRSLGPATMAGRLVDLGRYPGLVAAARDGDRVRGEVVELTDPARSFAWLDDYEGIVAGEHPHNEYERALREVALADGLSLEAWVYLYRRAFDPTQVIDGGDWLVPRA